MAWKDYLGQRVIIQSNEGPAEVGTLVGVEAWHSKDFPIVTKDSDGIEYVVMGILLPYRQDILDTLNSMPHLQAWEFCVGFSRLTQARFAR